MTLEAITCEGSAEQAILTLWLEQSMLTIKKEDILDNEVIRIRKANAFCEKYLRRGFEGKVTVYRVLDSRRENFKLTGRNKKDFEHRIDVVNVITAPEIEILYIIAEGKHQEFQRSKKKPSEFCIQVLKCKRIKEYNFVYEYFTDTGKLVATLKEYNRIHKKERGEVYLYDLLEECYKK